MSGRLVAVWLLAAAIICGTALSVARIWGPISLWTGATSTVLSLVAGALAAKGRLRGTSRGARDNGSGVVAALAFAEATHDDRTGLLITGAEEFGMVGARIFAELKGKELKGAKVVNIDTIDDEGLLYVVSHDARGAAAAVALAGRLYATGLRVRTRGLPLGILVDSLPLARAGAVAITIGRLTWRTLGLIHTPADVPETLSLETAERVGRALALN